MANMKNDVDNLFILELQKGFEKGANDFVRRHKENMRRKQMFGYYLRRLKVVVRKGKDYIVGLFDQG